MTQAWYYALAAILVALFALLAWVPNKWVKRRLLFSVMLVFLVGASILVPAEWFDVLPDDLTGFESVMLFALALAVCNAAVSVLFNPRKGQGVSDRWPSIVQDAVILGGPLLLALGLFGDKLLAGVVGSAVILGIALRDTLGNLFSGLALQSEKPFLVGDWVRVARREGRVLEATWRATKIRTKSGNLVIIPNSVISQDAMSNYSKPSPVMRMEKIIGMRHDVPPNDFKKVALAAQREVDDILNEPKGDVLTHEFGDHAIYYRCRFWIDDFSRSEPIIDAFTTLLYYRLRRAGLPLPVPVRDLKITERLDDQVIGEAVEDPRLAFVEKVDLFAALKEVHKESIVTAMEPITFADRERLVREGDKGASMFFIRSGSVRIGLERDDGVHEVAVLSPGQYLGEMALLTGEPRSASAFAIGDVEAYILEKERFREVLELDPDVANVICEVMADRRQRLLETSSEIASKSGKNTEMQRNFLKKVQGFFGL